MKILVTGATGFIGTHLIARLKQTNHDVTCLVRETSDTEYLEQADVRIITGDVTDRVSVQKAVAGQDWLFNLANVYSFWEPDSSTYARVNIDGTRNVLEAAIGARVSKVIHVSTGGVYGKPADLPFSEDSRPGELRFSEYFETKYEGDRIAWEMFRTAGLPLVVIYPCAVVGPGDPKATGKYLRDLVTRRLPARVFEKSVITLVHVRDVADAILKAAEKPDNLGEKYLIGVHHYSFGELNRLASEMSGVRLPVLKLPDFLAMLGARLLTLVANVTKTPPPWGMAVDQMRVMKHGFVVDGSKAERELGISYTPLEIAVREEVESVCG